MINLEASGLSKTETKVYLALLKNNEWVPSKLAKVVNESRTNTYKILDSLEALGIVKKYEKNKKFHYSANNPSLLLQLARDRRAQAEKSQKELELNIDSLTKQYIDNTERPGISYYQGEKELKEIYLDQIKTREDIYIIRPDYNMDIYDFDFMSDLRHMARKAGIKRFAITPDRKMAPKNYKESDPYMLLTRTWMKQKDYTAPVEWNIYGDKLAILSFGNEAIGTIIESKQIAEAFRQLYSMLEKGLKNDPDYKNMPVNAKYTGSYGK